MSAEQLAVSKLIETGDIVSFLDAGITESFFMEERWLKAWKWTYEYWTRHRSMPTAGAFKRQFPSYKLVEPVDDPLTGLIDELRAKRKHVIVQEGLTEAVLLMDTESPEAALEAVARFVSNVNLEVSETEVLSVVQQMGGFITDVIKRAPTSLLGLPTGFPTIDEATGGLQPEQLITLIGPPKRGKSNIAVAIALAAALHGKRVLFISFEMSNNEIQLRILCIGAQVGLTPLMRGMTTAIDQERMWQFEAEMLDSGGEIILVHDTASTATVGTVAAKQEQHKPDLVIIDGAYMMDDENGERKGTPQALTNITRSLKRLAQRTRTPFFITTQALLSRVSKKGGVQMESAGYSSSFAQDSDVILGIDREDLSEPKAKLKVIAGRSALGTETEITFDLGQGYVAETADGSTMRPMADDAEDSDDVVD